MASEQDDVVYAHIDDDESSETDDELEDPEEEDLNSPSTSSPIAISAATPAPSTTTSAAAVTIALPASSAITVAALPIDPDPERQRMTEIVQKPPVDESRRLFQRLWNDEDEIELLRGFLDYTTSHRGGGGSSHHHDTAAFYEQIKSKLQLDFNKNQLVEKLRRLKKKYRNAMNKINSGKDISFKSPHDQATFEISRKIWSDTGKIIGFEDNVLDDDENHNHVINTTTSSNFNLTHCSNPNFEMRIEDGVERKVGSSSSNRSRKRSRAKLGRTEEERGCVSDGVGANINGNENSGGGGGGNDRNCGGGDGGGSGGSVATAVEETLKSCLSPLLREFMNGTTAAAMMIGGGSRGIGSWAPMTSGPSVLPLFPSHLPAFGFGGMMELGNIGGHSHGGGGGGGGAGAGAGAGAGEILNEKWRKQQILELEVYSRRLELVQDQIRLALAELRAMGRGGGG